MKTPRRAVADHSRHRWRLILALAGTAVAGSVWLAIEVEAQTDPPVPPPLSSVPIPGPSNLGDFVRDPAKALVLGKALFWEMQVGSDGIQSCASCHFHAGSDSRARNQLSPGLLRVNSDGSPNPDYTTTRGLNYTLTASDFPFRLLSNPDDRNSTVLRDTNDIAGSQGVLFRKFVSVIPGVDIDVTLFEEDPDNFEINSVNVRRVEPRHTPSVINAVFNHRQFWDGRAQNDFNGVNPFGSRDVNARVWRADNPNNTPLAVAISLTDSSLASQATGPPTNKFEMSADGRTFFDVGQKFAKPWRDSGKKLKALRPLGKQQVHPQDSVLGPYSRYPDDGLNFTSYSELIRAAFHEIWWNSQWRIRVNEDGSRTPCTNCLNDSKTYALEEANFSMIFGIAVQMYEATLVSDDTPFDRFAAGDTGAMTESQVRGLGLFRSQTRGRCINCHGGPELTNASVRQINLTRFRRREGNFIDQGFNNIGLRPTTEDVAVGGNDPFGTPLSEARLVFQGQFPNPNPPPAPTDTLGVDGAFKVPSIRNVELTAPYFHNGGTATLRGVIEFYSRGGDFVPITSLNGQTISPLNTPIFTEQEKQDLVNFMLALTDERVRFRRAPFDHPELIFPNGHPGNTNWVTPELFEPGQAVTRLQSIAAVGANGAAPLPLFPVP